MKEMEELKKCPFCGGDSGYYEIEKVHRALLFTWDGEPNGGTEDINKWTSKRKYCIDCDRILPRKIKDRRVE